MSAHSSNCPVCDESIVVHIEPGVEPTRINPGYPAFVAGIDDPCGCYTLIQSSDEWVQKFDMTPEYYEERAVEGIEFITHKEEA